MTAKLGQVEAFEAEMGLYRLRWGDGSSEAVTEHELDGLLLRHGGHLLGRTFFAVSVMSITVTRHQDVCMKYLAICASCVTMFASMMRQLFGDKANAAHFALNVEPTSRQPAQLMQSTKARVLKLVRLAFTALPHEGRRVGGV